MKKEAVTMNYNQLNISTTAKFKTLTIIRDKMTKQFRYDGMLVDIIQLQPTDVQRFVLNLQVNLLYMPQSDADVAAFIDSIDDFVVLAGKSIAAYQLLCPDIRMSEIIPLVAKKANFTFDF